MGFAINKLESELVELFGEFSGSLKVGPDLAKGAGAFAEGVADLN